MALFFLFKHAVLFYTVGYFVTMVDPRIMWEQPLTLFLDTSLLSSCGCVASGLSSDVHIV